MFKIKNNILSLLSILVLALSILAGCAGSNQNRETTEPPPTIETRLPVSRLEAIPVTAIKITPSIDALPPLLHSPEFMGPVPLGEGVNTAGAEDSAYITYDGNDIYFFFTADPAVPAEKQLTDGVTGIYHSKKVGGVWQAAERVWLQRADDVSLDGCVQVQGDRMWFCSARQGNYRGIDMWVADYKDGRWVNWQNAGKLLNKDYEIGEMHITADGNELYFHADKTGGKGGVDIWVTRKVGSEWQEPENVQAVNSAETDGWPFVTRDGSELWFLRWYQGSPAIFRSKRVGGGWGAPELIVSQFAAEPSLDKDGNLYFTHHSYKDGKMLDADIYVAYRK
jgi:hypothetical protein